MIGQDATSHLKVAARAQYIIITLMFVLAFLLFVPTYFSMLKIWLRSETFAHGFLILPVVVYLIWQKKSELKNVSVQVDTTASLLIFMLVIAWAIGKLGHILIMQQFSAVGLIPAVIWLVLGKDVLKVLRFPLIYLFFMVPFGEFLVPVLQDFTASFVVKALRLIGIPVLLEGRFFYIPTASFEVAQACSGIRYLIASLALGVLYAYTTYQSRYRRIAFVFLSAIVPIFANGVRAFGIVFLVYVTDKEYGTGVDHLIYGWLFFGFIMLLLFWIGYLFRDKTQILERKDAAEKATAEVQFGNVSKFRLIYINLVVMIAVPVSILWLDNVESNQLSVAFSKPGVISGWDGPHEMVADWKPNYIGASMQNTYEYRKNDKFVYLYVANYSTQADGEELINSQNRLYDGKFWKRVLEYKKSVLFFQEVYETVNAIQISAKEKKMLLWYWYVVGDEVTANPVMAKLFEVKARLWRKQSESMVVILAAEYKDDVNDVESIMSSFTSVFSTDVRQNNYL